MVVIVNNLDLRLKLVNLCLHQLLSDLSQKLKVKLNEAALHDLLPEFNCLLLALFHDLPKLVREGISSLM